MLVLTFTKQIIVNALDLWKFYFIVHMMKKYYFYSFQRASKGVSKSVYVYVWCTMDCPITIYTNNMIKCSWLDTDSGTITTIIYYCCYYYHYFVFLFSSTCNSDGNSELYFYLHHPQWNAIKLLYGVYEMVQ